LEAGIDHAGFIGAEDAPGMVDEVKILEWVDVEDAAVVWGRSDVAEPGIGRGVGGRRGVVVAPGADTELYAGEIAVFR